MVEGGVAMVMAMAKTKLLFGFFFILNVSKTCTYAADTLSANQTIRYGETVVSPQETFELGFFNPGGNSRNHYVGIWYKKISNGTVVWVANRNKPLNGTLGALTLTLQGVLELRNGNGNVIWSSANSSMPTVKNPAAQLLDTGNFIISEEGDMDQENPIWQSFDFLTDTLLPGMKHGSNLVTGIERHYTSWKSVHDPAAGEFSVWVDIKGYPQVILTDAKGIIFRAGPWNGVRFSGDSGLKPNAIYRFNFVINQREIYYQYNLVNASVFTRLVLQPSGKIERLLWIDSKQEWNLYLAPEIDQCDRYAVCGPFGSCNINNSPACECLKGFEPTSPEQWRVADFSQGCRYTTRLDCGPGEGFKKYSNLKLPDTQGSWFDQTMTLKECDKMCKRNCSCSAYTNSNISGTGSGCLLWFGELIDIRTIAENGDDLYIRLAPSELASTEVYSKTSSEGRRVSIQIIVPVTSMVLIILLSIFLFYRFKGKKKSQEAVVIHLAETQGNEFELGHDSRIESVDVDLELPLFGLSTLVKATNNFSVYSKLGEGGFGPVYKVYMNL